MTESNRTLHIFDIQRFSLHDGPGIRTNVFCKGCPLRCPWCANPESQKAGPDLLHFENRCVRCGRCAVVCPEAAISFTTAGPVFDRRKCTGCGKCADTCLETALKLCGYDSTVEEIMAIVRRDADYYKNTGGGLTVSGGEPLCQPEAVAGLLAAAKAEGFSTAVETAGNVPDSAFRQVLPHTDLFLFDLKHASEEKYAEVTGGSLQNILNNLTLAAKHTQVIVRVPVIPGFNFEKQALTGIFRAAAECGAREADLLPYHILGKSKYAQLGCRYPYEEETPLSKEALLPAAELGTAMGLSVTIGDKELSGLRQK